MGQTLNKADAKALVTKIAEEGDLSSEFVDVNVAAIDAGHLEIVMEDGEPSFHLTAEGRKAAGL